MSDPMSLRNIKDWRSRAEKYRSMVEWFKSTDTRERMRRLAFDYDRMAEEEELRVGLPTGTQ